MNAFPRSTTQSANSQWVFDTQGQGWSVSGTGIQIIHCFDSALSVGCIQKRRSRSFTILGVTLPFRKARNYGLSCYTLVESSVLRTRSIISLNNIYWYKDKQVFLLSPISSTSSQLVASIFTTVTNYSKLNSNCETLQGLLFPCRPDPNSILAFLVQELQAAEDAGQRAWIMAHMPPGRTDVLRDQVRLGISGTTKSSKFYHTSQITSTK